MSTLSDPSEGALVVSAHVVVEREDPRGEDVAALLGEHLCLMRSQSRRSDQGEHSTFMTRAVPGA